jgi:glutaredoxin
MVTVTLVGTRGCPACVIVKRMLENIKPSYPDLEIEEVEATSPAGEDLIRRYGILASPGIIIDGQLFAMGIVSEEQLRNKLEELRGT